MLDLFGKIDWDEAYDYKRERPAGEPVRGYQRLVAGAQTGFAAGYAGSPASARGARRRCSLHDRPGAPGVVAGLSRPAGAGADRRSFHGPAHDRPDARGPHRGGRTAQRVSPPRRSGRHHRRAACPSLHRARACHADDRPGLRLDRGLDIASALAHPVIPRTSGRTLSRSSGPGVGSPEPTGIIMADSGSPPWRLRTCVPPPESRGQEDRGGRRFRGRSAGRRSVSV